MLMGQVLFWAYQASVTKMFHTSPSIPHYIFDLQRSKTKVKDAIITEMLGPKSFFCQNSAASVAIYVM